jgi:hypothetical protein
VARARSIKPGIFKNEVLGVADPFYTLAFEGLWMLSDKEGRLEDRPLRIKAEIFPYRDIDIEVLLDWLQKNKFIIRYKIGENRYIQIINFLKHQNPHKNEQPSIIPEFTGDIEEAGTNTDKIRTSTEQEPISSVALGLTPSSLTPSSLTPDSLNPLDAPRPERTKRFTKPSLAELNAYCRERGNAINPNHFLDHYESNGWRVGKNPMKDWKAAIRTWEQNEQSQPRGHPAKLSPMQRAIKACDDAFGKKEVIHGNAERCGETGNGQDDGKKVGLLPIAGRLANDNPGHGG